MRAAGPRQERRRSDSRAFRHEDAAVGGGRSIAQYAQHFVGVGGIFTADHAYERIRSGATLIQMYTGLIYEGPFAPARILRGLAARLERDGFNNVAEAIGVDVR